MKKILIYGKGSYIGEHYREGLEARGHQVTMIDSLVLKPGEFALEGYEVVINVVGIAHIKITPDMESLFYKINTDYAVNLCSLSKEAGVKQYIYMSSMNVFGDTSECIKSREQENPKNFYGKSKLLADLRIHAMEDDSFKVVSIRPPVVYGKGCKGNFTLLEKVASVAFMFPKYRNTRSMIFIDHLVNFLCQMVENEENGYFHPQNNKHITTTEAIVAIRRAKGKKTLLIPGMGWLIRLMMHFVTKAERAFSDDYYDLEFSRYKDNSYCPMDFDTTIQKSV